MLQEKAQTLLRLGFLIMVGRGGFGALARLTTINY